MMILLVVPRYNLTDKIRYDYVFPIGLGYIASVIKKEGYFLDCVNLNHIEGKTEEILHGTLEKKKYDIVMTGHIGIGYSIVEKIITSTKNHSSKPKMIIGGALVTSEPELMFNALKPDFAVIGEGEITIIELLRCIEKRKEPVNVRGIVFNKEGKAVFTGEREIIKDIDSIPFPDYEPLGFEKYLNNQTNSPYVNKLDYPRAYPLLCSRGCPNQCTFCYHSLGMRFRLRSLDNVFDELKIAVEKYKINALSIHDDLFSVNKVRLLEFCRRIEELSEEIGTKIMWSCQLTVSTIERDILEAIKEAGCNVVSLGFESYSPLVLKSMKKPITPAQIDKAVKLCMEMGIGMQGSFIFGDTAETKETAKETLEYWKKKCKGQIKIGFIQPYPGSEIYDRCLKNGIIKNRISYIKNEMAHTNWFNMTKSMSDREILELKEAILEARRRYYKYVIPLRIVKEKSERYKLKIKCPFCKSIEWYPNVGFENRIYYNTWGACKNCNMRFIVVSKLYKFTMDNYEKLDFLRKQYLRIMDNIRKKKM